jgi:hypothetical protein
MASQWEQLYTTATKPDGTLDQDQLAQLQAKFTSDHGADQMQQMNALLSQNDSKFPMLALYHSSQAKFDTWQSNWAVQNGVDINQLRTETSAYGALYGDPQGSRQYLTQHPELRRYETAKTHEWNRTQDGMIHALFYGNSAVVSQYLRAHRLTASQLVSGAAA